VTLSNNSQPAPSQRAATVSRQGLSGWRSKREVKPAAMRAGASPAWAISRM
jgi:hypothetical protein